MSAEIRLPAIRRFPVEEGHIQLFARAIGDPNPIYADAAYATRSTAGGIIAPPTFSEAGHHFDEGWPYRPRWGEPWFGSAAMPSGVEPATADKGTQMHGETHFVYHRPLRPGMVLSVRARAGKRWEKWGARSGSLQFHEIVSEFIDIDGSPLLDCTTVILKTEKTVEDTESAELKLVDEPAWGKAASYPMPPLSRSRITVGQKSQTVLVRNLSRAQIIMYAGVSGDFSPQHIDEIYNTQVAGYPTVFAHGMLTMGMAGRALTDYVSDGRLRTFGFQFRRQVWPGDSLFAVVEVADVVDAGAAASMRITVTNQYGQSIGKGYAQAVLDD